MSIPPPSSQPHQSITSNNSEILKDNTKEIDDLIGKVKKTAKTWSFSLLNYWGFSHTEMTTLIKELKEKVSTETIPGNIEKINKLFNDTIIISKSARTKSTERLPRHLQEMLELSTITLNNFNTSVEKLKNQIKTNKLLNDNISYYYFLNRTVDKCVNFNDIINDLNWLGQTMSHPLINQLYETVIEIYNPVLEKALALDPSSLKDFQRMNEACKIYLNDNHHMLERKVKFLSDFITFAEGLQFMPVSSSLEKFEEISKTLSGTCEEANALETRNLANEIIENKNKYGELINGVSDLPFVFENEIKKRIDFASKLNLNEFHKKYSRLELQAAAKSAGFSLQSIVAETKDFESRYNNVKDFSFKIDSFTVQGKYIDDRIIAAGAFGRVFSEIDAKGKSTAVKVVKKQPHQSHENLYKEGRILKEVYEKKNVVGSRDVRFDGDFMFILMDNIEGSNLRQRMNDKSSPLTVKQKISILRDSVIGLNQIHDMGYIFKDFKPDNIMIRDSDNTAHIVDFGTTEKEGDKSLYCTPAYAAPELRVTNNNRQTKNIDIYSFGLTMVELLTGTPPTSFCVTNVDYFYKDISDTIRQDLIDLTKRCLETTPEDRILTKDLGIKLEKILQKIA